MAVVQTEWEKVLFSNLLLQLAETLVFVYKFMVDGSVPGVEGVSECRLTSLMHD